MPSPPHTPHSSNSKIEPHTLSHPDGPGSKQPHPKSSTSPPPQTPQLSVSLVAQFGSKSSPFKTHPSVTKASQKVAADPEPKPSPSLSK